MLGICGKGYLHTCVRSSRTVTALVKAYIWPMLKHSLGELGFKRTTANGIPKLAKPTDIVEEVVDREQGFHLWNTRLSAINQEQRRVVKIILASAHGSAHWFFVDTPDGTGKTYFFTFLALYLEGQGVCTFSLSSTGITANLLPRLITEHTRLGLPLKLTRDSRLCISNRSARADKFSTGYVTMGWSSNVIGNCTASTWYLFARIGKEQSAA